MEDITYAYLILLYDDREPSAIFLTEAEAKAAAERYLAEYWENEASRIREADYLSEIEKKEELCILQELKDCWKEDGFVDDLIYIRQVPMGKLIDYNGKEY